MGTHFSLSPVSLCSFDPVRCLQMTWAQLSSEPQPATGPCAGRWLAGQLRVRPSSIKGQGQKRGAFLYSDEVVGPGLSAPLFSRYRSTPHFLCKGSKALWLEAQAAEEGHPRQHSSRPLLSSRVKRWTLPAGVPPSHCGILESKHSRHMGLRARTPTNARGGSVSTVEAQAGDPSSCTHHHPVHISTHFPSPTEWRRTEGSTFPGP